MPAARAVAGVWRPAAGDEPHALAGVGGRRLALFQFAISAVALLAVVASLGAIVLRQMAEDEALRGAGELTRAVGEGTLAPELSEAVLRGEPAALARFDAIVRERVLRAPIVRVKLWTPDGRIVYSDEPRLIGQRFTLTAEQREAARSGEMYAELSRLASSENGFERPEGELLEVYLPLWGPGGHEVIAETYQRVDRVDAAAGRIWRTFVPVLVAALVALALAQVPLGWWLARRVRAEARVRADLARHAEDATEEERRRIASELHDGVVQDLAGVAFELSATESRLGRADEQLAAVLRRAATVSRESIGALRALLVELAPPEPQIEDLAGALEQLVQPLRARGVGVTLETSMDGPPDDDRDQLVYRAAREALRNVERHAAATHVTVAVQATDDAVRLLVEDDGRGMTAADLAEQRSAGHVGLSLLAHRVVALGGRLAIASEPGRGTRVTLELG